MTQNMEEKRNHQRIVIKNLSIDASDGITLFHAKISDASRFGLRVTNLPTGINGTVEKMTVVVCGQGRDFIMNIRPKWSTRDGVSNSIGAEILGPPWNWTELIMRLEKKWHDDVWDNIPF